AAVPVRRSRRGGPPALVETGSERRFPLGPEPPPPLVGPTSPRRRRERRCAGHRRGLRSTRAPGHDPPTARPAPPCLGWWPGVGGAAACWSLRDGSFPPPERPVRVTFQNLP